jgi:hypothetical protein
MDLFDDFVDDRRLALFVFIIAPILPLFEEIGAS